MSPIASLPEGESVVSMCFYSGALIVASQKSLYELTLTLEGYVLKPILFVLSEQA